MSECITVNELIDGLNKIKEQMKEFEDVGGWKVRIGTGRCDEIYATNVFISTLSCPPWRYELPRKFRCDDEVYVMCREMKGDLT